MDNFETRDTGRQRKTYGNVLAGILLLVVGGVLLLRQASYPLPDWLFKWPMIVISFGLFIGAANRFRDLGFLFVMCVGVFFEIGYIWPTIDVWDYIVPAVIILIGLLLIFKRKLPGANWKKNEHQPFVEVATTSNLHSEKKASGKEDVVEAVAIFGSVKKTLFSKNFRGGEIVSVFGGVELDLSQADFQDKVVLEAVQIFGGAKLIVPSTWQVRSEAVAIFGGIEDKRKNVAENPERVLVLEGFAMFGGIEIKSY